MATKEPLRQGEKLSDRLLDSLLYAVPYAVSFLTPRPSENEVVRDVEELLNRSQYPRDRVPSLLGTLRARLPLSRPELFNNVQRLTPHLHRGDREFLVLLLIERYGNERPPEGSHDSSGPMPVAELLDVCPVWTAALTNESDLFDPVPTSGHSRTKALSIDCRDLFAPERDSRDQGRLLRAPSGQIFFLFRPEKLSPSIRLIQEGSEIRWCNRSIHSSDLDLYFHLAQVEQELPAALYLSVESGDVVIHRDKRQAGSQHLVIRRSGLQFEAEVMTITDPASSPLGRTKRLVLSDTIQISGMNTSLRHIIQAGVVGLPLVEELAVSHLNHSFPDGSKALNDVSFRTQFGKLVGVLGPSGSGKSTLLSLLGGSPLRNPESIRVNGQPIHRYFETHTVGFVPQDDTLLPELTVRETLEYGLRLRNPSASREQCERVVSQVIESVDLVSESGLLVGSPENKTLSGGQRKRVNIALELLNDSNWLLLDEPTSGLSSADAMEIGEVLKRRAEAGSLVIVVLHQPGQALLELFDELLVLDRGGHLAYFGPSPGIENHFRRFARKERARYSSTAEFVFDTLEQPRRSISGKNERERVMTPEAWERLFTFSRKKEKLLRLGSDHPVPSPPMHSAWQPGKQIRVLLTLLAREFQSRFRSYSQWGVSFLAALFLGILTGFSCRDAPPGMDYSFAENGAFLNFCFLTVIVVLFFSVAAGVSEIVKDRSTRRRESRLGLSTLSYLLSKWIPIHLTTALQVALYLLTSFWILEIPEAIFWWWLFLSVPVAAAGIGLGLAVSSLPFMTERSALAAIPILLIPQIILAGAEPFTFARMQHLRFFPSEVTSSTETGNEVQPPFVAQLSPSRWAREGLIRVHHLHSASAIRSEAINALAEETGEALGKITTALRPLKADPPDFALAGERFLKATGKNLTENQITAYAFLQASETSDFGALPAWIQERSAPISPLINKDFKSDLPSWNHPRPQHVGRFDLPARWLNSTVLIGFCFTFFTISWLFLVYERKQRTRSHA